MPGGGRESEMVYNNNKKSYLDFSRTEHIIKLPFFQFCFFHFSTMNTLIYNEKLLKIQMNL